jgi:Heterokaryon incompatibility protein (HET)
MPCHLRNCGKGGHTELECPEWGAGALLPTRLLDVGSRLGEFVRLYVPKPGERDRYLTLSYCWGKDGHKARTTASTFEEYKKGIPWEILPKTIQDAITVARNTGFRYLWVDGLCIIQADKPGNYSSDWDKESSRVARYYRKSAFTIAATSAEDCHQGLFLEESELCWTIPQFPIHFKVSHSEEQSFDGYLYWHLPNFKASVIDSPLLKRGWVAQERISANRIVHFTQEGVWWECRDQYAPELGSNFELDESIKDQSFKYFEPPVWYQIGDDMEESRSINEALDFTGMFFFKWCNAIKMFSALQFSFADDRLVAISSIAQQFCINARPGFGRDIAYAAGLLGDYLPRGLAWMSLVSSETGSSPSWTWASVNHPVTFLELEEYIENGQREAPKWEFHVNVYQCYVRSVNEEQPYGRVSFGYLALQGWFAKIPLHEYFEAGTGNPKKEASPTVDSSTSTDSLSGSSNTSIANTSQRAKKSRIAWDIIQQTDIFEANPYYCLLLCSSDEKQIALVTVIDWSLCFELGSYSFKRVGMLILHKEDGIGGDKFWGAEELKVDIKVV